MSDDTDHPSSVVDDLLMLTDDMINSPENVVEVLNVEIDKLQRRFTLLSAIRDSLLPDECDLQIEEVEQPPQLTASTSNFDLESLITKHISQHGPSMPGDIGKAIGVHGTKIGRVVSASNQFARDGKLIKLAQ